MPSLIRLRDHRKEQKRKIPITSNSKGVFNSLQAKISSILTILSVSGIIDVAEYATLSNDNLQTSDVSEDEINADNEEVEIPNGNAATKMFHLKFAGDGTVVSRNITIFNFAFSCLDESNRCESASGHYTLGIFEINKET